MGAIRPKYVIFGKVGPSKLKHCSASRPPAAPAARPGVAGCDGRRLRRLAGLSEKELRREWQCRRPEEHRRFRRARTRSWGFWVVALQSANARLGSPIAAPKLEYRCTNRGVWALLALVLCCRSPTVVAPQSKEVARRILLLYPNDNAQPATAIIGEAIRKRLVEQLPLKVEIFTEFLDTTRFQGAAHEDLVARYLSEKYAQTSLDLVVTLGPDALRFMVHVARNRPAGPIVYCCVSHQSLSGVASSDDINGIVSEFDLTRTLALAEQLQPKARLLR